MKRSLSSAFFAVMSRNAILLLISLVMTPILTRLLGAEQYGVYATLLSVYGLMNVFFTSGVNIGIKKYLAEDRPLEEWKNQAFAFYFRVSMSLSLIGASIFIAVSNSGIVERYLGSEYVLYFSVLSIYFVFIQTSEYVARSLMGLQLEHISEPIRVLRKITFAISATILLIFGYEVLGVLVAHILGSVISLVVAIYYIRKYIDVYYIFKKLSKDFPAKEMLFFNNYQIMFVVLLMTFHHVDVLMLRAFTTETQVGYYKAALVIIGFLWLVPQAVRNVLIQSVSEYWRKDAVDKINEISTDVTRYSFLFTALLAIGVGALASEFVPLYFGGEFRPAILPLLILLPGTVAFAISRPVFTITQAKGQLRPLVIIIGVLAAVNFVLNLVLIPAFGIIGAAIATSIGYGLLPIGNLICARYVGFDPFTGSRAPRILLTCMISIPIIGGIAHIVPGLISMLIVPPSGAFVYIVIAYMVGAIHRSDVELVIERIIPIYKQVT